MGNAAVKLPVPDAKQELLESVGSLDGIEIFHNQVLVAVYLRPEKTAGGIFLADQTRNEDKYQGKVGLVLKKGPLAFQNDGATDFAGQNVNVGDWIAFRPSDGWSLQINKTMCRMLEDVHIKGRVAAPDAIY